MPVTALNINQPVAHCVYHDAVIGGEFQTTQLQISWFC
jgi:hypothetical protein